MKLLLSVLLLLIGNTYCFADSQVFRFHILDDPQSLDPAHIRGASGNYVFYNLYRSLYRYDTKKGLVPEGATNCNWLSSKQLLCNLNPRVKWSDGSVVVAEDYVRAFRRLFAAQTKSEVPAQLLALKNARMILAGTKEPSDLGIQAKGPQKLIFDFDKVDKDFVYRLTSPALAPLKMPPPSVKKADSLISNGPYRIKNWEGGRRVLLTPNRHYPFGNPKRPEVEVSIVTDDAAAGNLYQAGRLDFLRRIPTSDIPQHKGKAGFMQIPMLRFDYVGFGPELQKQPNLLKALAHALEFKHLKNLYHALGRPGCPPLPISFFTSRPCLDFNLELAKTALKKADFKSHRNLTIYYSMLGGEDHRKGMEWVQHQWYKHLGIQAQIKPVERGMMGSTLRSNQRAIFRKGVPIDRPTCLAALEVFESSHPENYIGLKSKTFDSLLLKMRKTDKEPLRKKLCSQATKLLLDNSQIIPLGEMHFSMLHNNKFSNWSVNSMNQLNLSNITTE